MGPGGADAEEVIGLDATEKLLADQPPLVPAGGGRVAKSIAPEEAAPLDPMVPAEIGPEATAGWLADMDPGGLLPASPELPELAHELPGCELARGSRVRMMGWDAGA
ncbi:MAG: hypothetical protein RMI90_01610 [Thermoguttaceae bacterium]|nr:hypothetical protein [Thermoguttaceae bacterium]